MDETSNHSLEDEDDPPPPPPPDFDFPAFVLDNGTGRIKAGVCGTLHPSITIRSLIGRPIQRSSARRILRKKASDAPLDPVDGHPVPSLLFGPELDAYISSTPNVELSNAITSGSVTDWEAMERVWAYCYAELEVDAMSAPLLVTEPPMNPRRGRERMMEVFFETFQVPGYCPLLAGTCALYASGRTTGLVLDIGEGVSHITPVFESFAIGSAVNRHEVAGGAITQYLSRILSDSGYNFGSTRQDLELARTMKESVCFLRNSTHPPFDASSESTTYELPDGQLVQIRDETFRAAELLFAPSLIGSEAPPLHIMVHHAIQQCAIDMRKPLMSNIVLSGGTSLMQGLVPRLSEELSYVLQGNAFHAVKIIDAKDRADNVWIGASVVATLSTFNDVVLTKETYDENGSSCLPALCV